MAKATVDQILDEVNALEPREKERLISRLTTPAKSSVNEPQRDQLRQALRKSGLVTQERKLRTGGSAAERRLIDVMGKPVSETIIEERR